MLERQMWNFPVIKIEERITFLVILYNWSQMFQEYVYSLDPFVLNKMYEVRWINTDTEDKYQQYMKNYFFYTSLPVNKLIPASFQQVQAPINIFFWDIVMFRCLFIKLLWILLSIGNVIFGRKKMLYVVW